MKIIVSETKEDLGRAAAARGAELLASALKRSGRARFILATGASQFEMLRNLVQAQGIDWTAAEMFHLDEYVGLSAEHLASFRHYLSERFVKVAHPGTVCYVEGDAADLQEELGRLRNRITEAPIDVAFVGIGENGHLAFNDPPADFETKEPYLVVELDKACRMQQVGEGWFASLEEVPRQAVSMSVRQIMASRAIVCAVPDGRKAAAVRDCLSKGAAVSPLHPASIHKTHDNAFIFLDKDSASLLAE